VYLKKIGSPHWTISATTSSVQQRDVSTNAGLRPDIRRPVVPSQVVAAEYSVLVASIDVAGIRE
jgi:hypothetical protein